MINKKIKTAVLAIALGCLNAPLHSAFIGITVEGKQKGKVEAVKYKDNLYLDARNAAKLFKGSFYIRPRSGTITLKIKGKRYVFTKGSKSYLSDTGQKELVSAVIEYKKKIFFPLDFFTGDDFSKTADRDIYYDASLKELKITKRYNVGELEYFSFGDLTRVTFELKDRTEYSYKKKDSHHIEITIPNARAKKPERIDFKNGTVRSVRVSRFSKGTLVTLLLAGRAKFWDVSLEDSLLIIEASSKEKDIIKPAQPSTIKPAKKTDKFTDLKDIEGEIVLDFAAAKKIIPAKPKAEAIPVVVSTTLTIPDKTDTGKSGKKIIIIDAGHGGKDSGCVSKRGLTEKEINILIAKSLSGLFKRHKNFQIVMTRTKDVFIPLHKRSKIANDKKADIFISIHANSHRSTKQSGFEVYALSDNASDPWAAEVAKLENSVRELESNNLTTSADILLHSMAKDENMNSSGIIAGLIVKSVIKSLPLKNRGVKKANFYVLRGTYCPSVLVETGFITNRKDRKVLQSSGYRKKIAVSIYKAIISYGKMKGWKI